MIFEAGKSNMYYRGNLLKHSAPTMHNLRLEPDNIPVVMANKTLTDKMKADFAVNYIGLYEKFDISEQAKTLVTFAKHYRSGSFCWRMSPVGQNLFISEAVKSLYPGNMTCRSELTANILLGLHTEARRMDMFRQPSLDWIAKYLYPERGESARFIAKASQFIRSFETDQHYPPLPA
jgi:hypothetical protein